MVFKITRIRPTSPNGRIGNGSFVGHIIALWCEKITSDLTNKLFISEEQPDHVLPRTHTSALGMYVSKVKGNSWVGWTFWEVRMLIAGNSDSASHSLHKDTGRRRSLHTTGVGCVNTPEVDSFCTNLQLFTLVFRNATRLNNWSKFNGNLSLFIVHGHRQCPSHVTMTTHKISLSHKPQVELIHLIISQSIHNLKLFSFSPVSWFTRTARETIHSTAPIE